VIILITAASSVRSAACLNQHEKAATWRAKIKGTAFQGQEWAADIGGQIVGILERRLAAMRSGAREARSTVLSILFPNKAVLAGRFGCCRSAIYRHRPFGHDWSSPRCRLGRGDAVPLGEKFDDPDPT